MTAKFGRMDSALKARWTGKLRSGEYEQGAGVLRNKDNQYCCLGVLCDILAEEVGGKWTQTGTDGEYQFITKIDGDSRAVTAGLPPVIRQLTGIESLGYFANDVKPDGVEYIDSPNGNGERYFSLSLMNDEGVTFEEIADVIDENF